MVYEEFRGGTEYVIKAIGEITTDDLVGKMLFDRFQKGTTRKISLGGKKLTYKEALEYFESGQMTKAEYDSLMKRSVSKSLTKEREESLAKRILGKEGLVTNLFGLNYCEIEPSQKTELVDKSSSMKGFRTFLRPYFERRLVEDSLGLDSYEPELWDFVDGKKGLDNFITTLTTLRFVLGQHIDWDSQGRLKYLDNQELNLEYCEAIQKGSVFRLGRILRDLPNRLR